MLRDKLKDTAYFDKNIKYSIGVTEKRINKLNSNKQLSTDSKMMNSFRITSNSVAVLCERYSRGDDLNEFKAHLFTALEYRQQQKHFADLLPAKEQKSRLGWEEIREDYLEDWLDWLSYAYCLNMGQDYYQQVLTLMGNEGLDALFDTVAVKMGRSERVVAPSLLFKKRFGKLYKVIEAEDDKRPALMLAYLDAWYKLIGSPDYHLMDTDAYDGYWCWEAALIVKLYGIDDSAFIDHQYYPKDLVHWQEDNG